jgi:hypothetical protein
MSAPPVQHGRPAPENVSRRRPWIVPCSSTVMSDERSTPVRDEIEEQRATEEQTQKIDAIVGDEVLGYEGSGHEEHSGQSSAGDQRREDGLQDRLADNRPEQMK